MMSAPIPTPDITKPSPNMDFKNKKTFKLSEDNINFLLSLSTNEKIIFFEIEKENEFPKKEYNLLLDLEQLININKYFNQFESINEVKSSFETLIEMKKISLINEEKEIKIKIINPLNKNEFYISIPLKEKSLKNEIDSIIPYITSLNDKINKLENRVSILENKVNELYSIKEEYCKLKTKNIEKENKLFQESNIIKSEDEKIILSWFDRKPLRFNLLLNTKKDGDLTSTFYQKCGNKCPTMLFVKTTNGDIFGGYTTQLWSKSGFSADEKSFVFSLNLKQKYKVTNKDKAILFRDSYFQFGRCCFRICNNCTTNSSNYINDNKNSYDIPSGYALTGGQSNFVVSSYEVYQIEF